MDEPTRGTVLIVDDVPTNTAILGKVLGVEHDVLLATSGEEALDIAARHRLDLVLLDVVMPGMDGYDVCRALKADPTTRDVPVIFLTAMHDEEDEERGLTAGAIDYVGKPFSLPIVQARVRNHLISKLRADQINASNTKLELLYSRVKEDLEAAARLQYSLLPDGGKMIHHARFDFLYNPSQFLGGDVLNYFSIGDNLAAFYVADVAGHGVPSSLLSVTLSNMMTPEFCTKVAGPIDDELGVPRPSTVASALNRRFLGDGVRMDYLTAAYGIIDTASGVTRICQAGQPSPIVIRRDGSIETVGTGGFPIGMFDDATFEDLSIRLRPGDRLALFSDGITECESPLKVQFGTAGLVAALLQDRAHTLEAVRTRITGWLEGHPPSDDVSLIVMTLTDVADG